MANLSRTIRKLDEKLTNPDFINPLHQNPPNTVNPNNSIPNSPITVSPNSITPENFETQENEDGGRGNWRNRKSDLPTFWGEDPDGWILQAERYFTFYSLSEKEKMESCVVSLEGAALHWFHWEHQRRPITRWEELKGLILRRFRSVEEGTLHEQWMSVEQTRSVAEYNLEFVEKANALGMIPENFAMGAYLKGLDERVRKELRPLEPFGVMLGNGEQIKKAGICQKLSVEIQGIVIVDDFLLLELGNTDMILGLQWLERLGEITVNWREQIMRFLWEETMVELRGDPSLGHSQVSLKAIMRTVRKEKQGLLIGIE
uniref:Retrotransposon gag domain-containing protein n=1 Tax=Amaranthus palmeri TaxID=107608 RepID=A0A6C0T5F8_AMAPA|nr:hypothetical protein AP_R.00g000396-v1.0.a3 [Amaranthus palmeri]